MNETKSSMRLNIFNKKNFDVIQNVNLENSNIANIFRKISSGKNKKSNLDNPKEIDIILDLVPDGILISNQFGKVMASNKAYHILTGYTKDQIVGKLASEIPAVELTEKMNYWTNIQSILTRGEIDGFEFVYRHADGSKRWGEARAKLFKTGFFSGGAIAVMRDITERKQKDEELKRLVSELERSNRELDDYTYAVSHDLKAPLRTIESFSSFLLEDHSDNLDDEGKEYLKRMQLATKRMNTLIQDLLLISRVGRLNTEIELVDLNEVINDINNDMETTLNENNGEIIYTQLPIIKSQKVWIRQLFSNLISNGLKFNESTNPKVWINCEENKEQYVFSIKDNGIGIDKKHHDKIFRIFQRLHTVNEYPGTGAGLTICKKIVESMGGSISLDSDLGKGTEFNITLPKPDDESEENNVYHQFENDTLSIVHENT